MDNFFGNQHSSEELQRRFSQQQAQRQLSSSSQNHSPAGLQPGSAISTIADTPMIGGDTLDDIIRDNDQELQRRRSIPQSYGSHLVQDEAQRRMSMLEFGGANADFTSFQFPNEVMDSGFSGIDTNVSLAASMPNFSQQDMMQMTDDFSPVSPTVMSTMMPATFANMNMGPLGTDSTAMDLFTPATMPTHFPTNSITAPAPDFMDMNPEESSVGSTTGLGVSQREDDMITVTPSFVATTRASNQQPQDLSMAIQPHIPQSITSETTSPIPMQSSNLLPSQALSQPRTSQPPSSIGSEVPPGLRMRTGHGNVYSSSGFDIIRALSLIANRPNPEVTLGAVDFSCAFVVCDVKGNDCPIIYVSDNFQNLTGYNRYEIIGKNCRFLQSPDGKVEAGSKRQFIDNSSVYKLKLKIAARQEVQQSLLNYRKGGRPFLNLLTMIPIPWDTDEIRYFIGFQIDIVENSDAIGPEGETGRGMIVDYKHTGIGQYIWEGPQITNWDAESGQTLAANEVSALLQQFKSKGTVSDWHKPSWDKMLLENSDDVVHVLSLKGVFLYVSPSCKKVVGYTVKELTGKPLSEVCHPSDIVPVTRELKESSAGSIVNTVFRFRCKESSYTWFESHGSLFIEQGKGRKIIVLVGRKRPVFSLSRKDLEANGGVGENELWTKISPSGLFLFVSSGVRLLLDHQPEDLVGTSIQELMRKESRAEFGRSIEKARSGKIVTCKHEVHHRRGQVLKAQTVLYPGDAAQGQNPTFLIAQTKLSKPSSRNIIPATTSQGSIRSSGSAVTRDASSLITGVGTAGAGGANADPVDLGLIEDDDIFEELRVTKTSSWQYELRNLEKDNRKLAVELNNLSSNRKKRKRRKGLGNFMRDCANCHTRNTPEWRRGPSGQRDLCNSCGLRWAKQMGRVSPRNSSRGGNGDAQSKLSNSPIHTSPLRRDSTAGTPPHGGTTAAAGGEGTGTGAGLVALSSMPPPSQPLLGGGSGHEMTIIQEERETSTS